jgi:hypothetical protein
MIPRTFPSILESAKTKMVVYVLPSVDGLQAWIDYIPVKGVTTENTAVENTYANDGYQVMKTLDGTSNLQAWVDYIPVFESASFDKPWSTDIGGFIPAGGLFSVLGSLFGNNEQGAWYDPSDMATLFQDQAGTTPVTAVEQPVGLMLDKSKGLVLGPERVTNGDFSNGTTGWTIGSNITLVSVVDGELQFTGNGTLLATNANWVSQVVFEAEDFKRYVVEFDARWISGGNLQAGAGFNLARTIQPNTSLTRYSFVTGRGAAGGGDLRQRVTFSADSGAVWRIDNISVRELPGNHAFTPAAATTSRPVLSARVNLLQKTEEFDDAYWTSTLVNGARNVTVSADQTTAPDGTTTADKIIGANTTSVKDLIKGWNRAPGSLVAGTYSFSMYFKKDNHDYVALYLSDAGNGGNGHVVFDLANGTVTQTGGSYYSSSSIQDVFGDGTWYRANAVFSLSATNVAMVCGVCFVPNATGNTFNNFGGGTTSSAAPDVAVFVWGADLRVTNDGVGIPEYQRVNTATDYDTAGFPMYLRFDGSDDFMQTNSIDFTATDKMTVFAGVRKFSDAGVANVLCELSSSRISNNGAFTINAPGGGSTQYLFASKGTSDALAATTLAVYAAPITNTLTAFGNISGASTILRINGTQAASPGTSQGTGNYGNHPLFIGSRAGTTLPFNGRLTQLIIRGAQTSDPLIASTEAFVNSKTKAF